MLTLVLKSEGELDYDWLALAGGEGRRGGWELGMGMFGVVVVSRDVVVVGVVFGIVVVDGSGGCGCVFLEGL